MAKKAAKKRSGKRRTDKRPRFKTLPQKAPPELVAALERIDDRWEAYHAAQPKVTDEGRRLLDRALAIRDGLIPPPWVKGKRGDGPQVRRAKILMKAVYPNDEWHSMMTKAVRAGCAETAEARGWRLPSADIFSIATGRRKRRPR
jgi:hypothetical protein